VASFPPPEPVPGARLLFSLDPAVAYLNHGTVGVVPVPVQRTQQRLRDEMEANPQRFMTRGLTDRVAHARRYLAGFVGADPDRSALVDNATTGIAVVLNSLDLAPGDEVLTTDHGYGAVDIACAARGLRRRVVPLPLIAGDDEVVAAISGAVVDGRPRLAIVDLVTSPTARRLPVERIASVLRERGIPLLVDAAHAPGMLPLAVDEIGADFLVGNLHKWAFAPRGTGLLTVAPRWRTAIRPLVVSWLQEEGYPASVEWGGTVDRTGWLAAPTGVFVLRTLGIDRVRAHNAALVRYGQETVGAALGVTPDRLPDPGGPLAMRIVPLPSGLPATADTAVRLRERISDELRAEVAVGAWRDGMLLRLSAQVYNRPEDFDRLAAGLPALLATERAAVN
jgi:isopenicillin-N epimerase